MTQEYDLIVIGAGWFGLAAAKPYIQLHPDHRILIIEAASSCGGTWSADRLYPGLKSNNLVGSYEYPDFPMSEEIYGVKEGSHIPGAVLHKYLTDFATTFGIFERTRFNTKVDTLEKAGSEWKITITTNDASLEELRTKKVILATGLTSQPNMPSYPGQEKFNFHLFHSKDFCKFGGTVNTSRKVVVVGGSKSALDIAYAFVTEGKAEVDLVIRPTGNGPVWLAQPYATPLKRRLEEFINTRALTWLSPCPFGDEDGYSMARGFFQGTGFGRLVVHNFWNAMSSGMIDSNEYDDHPETFKLKPWNSVLWTGSGVAVHNFETSIFDLVKEGKIRVHLTDIAKLDKKQVHLQDGKTLEADTIVCATGWKKGPSVAFVNFGEAGIGLSCSAEEEQRLAGEADKEILKRFPILKSQPVLRFTPKKDKPLRLYRFAVPPTMIQDHSIAFAGLVSTVSTAVCASIQGLWITAFLDGKLRRVAKDEKSAIKEIMLHTQWGKWRYPCGYGAELPDFFYDAMSYVDLMLRDLGLKNHRKGSDIAEIMEPYTPKDYAGLVEELKALHGLSSATTKLV